jgi:hypothetical protein
LTFGVVPLNFAQKIGELSINGNVVLQPNTWYTCPTGKKAIATLRVTCASTGTGAEGRLRDPSDTYNLKRWGNATGSTSPSADLCDINIWVELQYILTAGQTIKTTQDAGTNAQFKISGKILELPA